MSTSEAPQAAPVLPELRRNRTFQFILLGNAISVLGDGFHTVALGIWVLQVTGSASAMSAVMAVRILMGILLGAIGGTLADRTDRRRLMWTMDLARGLIVLGIAWLVGTPGTSFAAILALVAVLSAATQLRAPAFSASLRHIVGKDHLQQASSLMQITNTGAQVLGPLLGGAVAAAFGGWAALMGDASSFFVSGACVLLAGAFPSPRRPAQERAPFWRDLLAGWTYIRQQPLIFSLTVLGPLLNFFGSAIGVLLPVLAIKVWQVSPAGFGAVEGTFPLGFALGSMAILALGKRIQRRGLWITGSMLLFSPAVALIALVPGMAWALPVILVMGVLEAFVNVLLSVALQTEVDPEVQGRVFGTLNSLMQIASPLAVILAGVLADLYGAGPVTLVAGIALGVTALLGSLLMPALRRYR